MKFWHRHLDIRELVVYWNWNIFISLDKYPLVACICSTLFVMNVMQVSSSLPQIGKNFLSLSWLVACPQTCKLPVTLKCSFLKFKKKKNIQMSSTNSLKFLYFTKKKKYQIYRNKKIESFDCQLLQMLKFQLKPNELP